MRNWQVLSGANIGLMICFSYGKKLRSSQSFKFKMQLPVKNEQPDYELMSTLISAIQKLVIADVVKFSDEKIKATKQVVG